MCDEKQKKNVSWTRNVEYMQDYMFLSTKDFCVFISIQHAAWQEGFRCESVGCSTTLVQTEISQQLLGGMSWNGQVQTVMMPRVQILQSSTIHWLSTNSRARFSLILWNISTSTSLIGTKWGTEMDRRCGGSLCDVTHCRLWFCSPEINILSVTILALWSQSDYIGWESGAGRQPGVDLLD